MHECTENILLASLYKIQLMAADLRVITYVMGTYYNPYIGWHREIRELTSATVRIVRQEVRNAQSI